MSNFIYRIFYSSFDKCFEQLTKIIYARIKYIEFSLDLNKLFKLEKYFNLLIKILLFYMLDLYTLIFNLDRNQIKSTFKVEYMMDIPMFEYDILPIFQNGNKLNNVISNKVFDHNNTYYEQVYLYSNFFKSYKSSVINCKNYPYMYKYMDILFTNLDILKELDYERDCALSSQAGAELKAELEKHLESWYKEWEGDLYPLNKQNFHEVNEQRLKALNTFVLEEIKEYEKLK
jgi:hypothetical protein